MLYYANAKVIKFIDIKVDFAGKEFVSIEPKPEQIGTYEIKSGCVMHGFFEQGYSRND